MSSTSSDGASVTKLSAKHAKRKAASTKSSSAAQDKNDLERRRHKCKIACQLSRKKRKQREIDMQKELSHLRPEYGRLQQLVTELETQLERYKQMIVTFCSVTMSCDNDDNQDDLFEPIVINEMT